MSLILELLSVNLLQLNSCQLCKKLIIFALDLNFQGQIEKNKIKSVFSDTIEFDCFFYNIDPLAGVWNWLKGNFDWR